MPVAVGAPVRFDALTEHPLSVQSAASLVASLDAQRSRVVARIERLRIERAADLRCADGPRSNDLEVEQKHLAAVESALAAQPTIVEYLSGRAAHPGDDVLVALAHPAIRAGIVGFEAVNWIRLGSRPGGGRPAHALLWQVDAVTDARSIADVLVRTGYSRADADESIIANYFAGWWTLPTLRPDQLVEHVRSDPSTLDAILGLSLLPPPETMVDHRGAALAVLEADTVVPVRYLPVLTELATGRSATHRAAAQRVLDRHGLGASISANLLQSRASEDRSNAVLWMQSTGGEASVARLSHVARYDSDPRVRARAVAALEALGEDIGCHLTAESFAAEAAAGLRRRLPASAIWFPFAQLPDCRYRSGADVPREVITWWIVLAATLRDPAGAGLIPRYLRTLDTGSARALSRQVLLSWLARDTTPVDDETALARAIDVVAQHERRMRAASYGRDQVEVPIDDLFEQLDLERDAIGSAVPSAIAEKGMLALAGALPGPELAETVRQYMRRHHLKRSQIDALLYVLAASDDPEPVQLLVAIARRYRTAGVQKTAQVLVVGVADRLGWSVDELADRMIPTAGFDGQRTLWLDFGPRMFRARVTESLALVIESADGDVIRRLPEPRAADVGAPSAKAALAAARKDLKAVVAVQRRRLYDAMCLRREWAGRQWRGLLLDHPIMGLVAAAYVWHVDGVAARPSPDGRLRTLHGETMTVADDATITLAHCTTLPADEIRQWQCRPSDVPPGFDQFRVVAPDFDPDLERGGDQQRDDLAGRWSSVFELRGWARRFEWDRGVTGDGARFDDYVKTFPTVGLQASVTFSGSELPETDHPVELGTLQVYRLDAGGRRVGAVAFDELPAGLATEISADYLELAG